MRLTQYSDHALRVLIHLAVLGDDARTTISAIAERHQVSRHHMVKVVHQLGQLGYVDTLRGKGGGLRLAQPPAQIVLGEVVRHTERQLDLVECFNDPGACVLTPHCGLRGVLTEALAAFLAVLDSYTLADLVGPDAAPARAFLLRAPLSA